MGVSATAPCSRSSIQFFVCRQSADQKHALGVGRLPVCTSMRLKRALVTHVPTKHTPVHVLRFCKDALLDY